MKRLVLITGTGRSGTSTMSGTFHHLGLSVPGPHLGANDSNPKGFFESRWAVKFHKRIISAARLHDMDGRPGAFGLAKAQITDADQAKLISYLRKHAAQADQIVVKDPRSVWAQRLWRDAASEAGLEIAYVSMLRHPAEVIGSRSTYYASKLEEGKRRRYEIFNVVRWINNSLVSERETRGEPRAFVRYTDLLTDWRPVLVGLAEQFSLTYDVDVASGAPTPVDDFIDPDLRRLRVTWDDLDVPADLREIAEAIWVDLNTLLESGGADESASADLDVQAARFEALFDDASAIAHDAIQEARALGEEAGAAEVLSGQKSAQVGESTPSSTPLDDAGGRELLRAVARRGVAAARTRARTGVRAVRDRLGRSG